MDDVEFQASQSCDTFIALPPATPEGTVIFGKNSDRPYTEVQEVIHREAANHESDAKLQCTYIEIKQCSHTHAVILSKPAWMWGAEMGANEHGVCVGNEAVHTKLLGPDDTEERLLGMDLIRLGLERGKTASETLGIITSLLEEHGQGGRCFEEETVKHMFYHNAYIIADPHEAWVLETAGKHWVAEKITAGVRNISNQLSITTNIDAMSAGIKEHAQSSGLWDGHGEFNFARIFQRDWSALYAKCPDNQKPDHRFKCGKELMEKYANGGNFSIQNMFNILRDVPSGICRVGFSISTGSQVSVLHPPSSKIPCNHWFTATPNPNYSVFKPFIFAPDVNIGKLTISPSYGAEDPVKRKPRFQKTVDRRHLLYKAHEHGEKIMRNKQKGKELQRVLSKLETQCVDDVQDFLHDFDESKLCEIKDLFKDVVESEFKFYK